MKRVILSVALVVASFTVISQDNAEANKKLFFGFNFGINNSNIQANDNPIDVVVRNKAGLAIGSFVGYHFSKNWALMAGAGLSFHQNELYSFSPNADQLLYRNMLASTLDFTLQPTYQINTKGNKAPYILLGPAMQIPLSRPVLSNEFNSGTNLALELGFGCNVQFSEFVFAPEIRYSYGINNVNANPALKNVNFHSLKFLFNFKA